MKLELIYLIGTFFVSVGVTYGLMKGQISQLKSDIARIENYYLRQVRINEKVSSIEAKIDFIIGEIRAKNNL